MSKIASRALDPAQANASWLRQHALDALVGLVERVYVDSDRALTATRGQDDWLALVPHEAERAVDVDWVRMSLRGVDSGVRPSELERAARRLPPGAYRFVTALEQAGFLRRLADSRLVLGPVWLFGVARAPGVDHAGLALSRGVGRSPGATACGAQAV